MDRIRFGLWFGLLAALWISYTTWVSENAPEPVIAASEDAPGVVGGTAPAVDDSDGVPLVGGGVGSGQTTVAAGSAETAAAVDAARLVRVQTDVLDLTISLDGGNLVRADLPAYPVHKDRPDEPVRLLDYDADDYWVIQSGFASLPDTPAPTHTQAFTTPQTDYRLENGRDTLELRLAWQGPDGLSAEKIYTFRRGQYAIDLELVVRNGGATQWPVRAYGRMVRVHNPVKRSYLSVDSYSYTGPVVYDGESFQRTDFDDLLTAPINHEVANGWVASIQHHFLAALIPPAGEAAAITANATGGRYTLAAAGPESAVAPGAELRYPLTFFVGPKLQEQLAAAAPDRKLKLTVDYGLLTPLSALLFLLLELIHGWVRNWGWSIVLTTVLIKAVFYKLTATSGRSMAKMRKLAPRMKALQEKHKEDRQALSAAMMDLYKKEKVNPAAGCLPILIQMPFFFAFYWVLVESVEMRQAPFMLWINDLSVRDPFFILPLIMIGSMWFQMRLNPAPPDPVQARVMQIMPFVFGGMFAFFPAGLVLYWLTNTLISIAQQWRINQLVAKES